jgi:sigma-B regulation protein RsbU (phosphoserine phosphatase)
MKMTPHYRVKPGRRTGQTFNLLSQASYEVYPPGREIPSLRRFQQSLLKIRRFDHTILDIKGERYLAAGFPCAQMTDFLLLSLRPLRPLTEELSSLRTKLWGFVALSIGFTVLLGMLLARQFLHPIRELAIGIDAVRRQQFSYKIPLAGGDELGELAAHFNRMMDSLQEMNLAIQVQSCLLPRDELRLGDYRVFGLSQPASELGGDYFDYVPLGEHQLLVLTGDVTGHGVPSALVMAMCKSVVRTHAKGDTSLTTILDNINDVIFQTFTGRDERLLMTLSAILVDTRRHEALFCNCGHPFPYLVPCSGYPTMVAGIGRPIGARKTLMTTAVPLSLAPGERLVFYSDGLVESLPIRNDEDGFEVFGEFLVPFRPMPIAEACREILARHPSRVSGAPQPDDFTIVILERSAP